MLDDEVEVERVYYVTDVDDVDEVDTERYVDKLLVVMLHIIDEVVVDDF